MEPTLPRSAYVDLEHFRAERERIFFRQWFCVGRQEELPGAGDHLVCDVAGESILVTRTRQGDLAAYYNVCRHRGSVLSAEPGKPSQAEIGPTGTFRGSIQCPYHNWTYSFTGELRAARFLDEDFDRATLPLHPVAVRMWNGWIWVNLEPATAPSLEEQVAVPGGYLDRYPLGELQSAHRIVYQVEANWKAIVENYNECYHCGPIHPELCELVPAFRQGGGANLDWKNGIEHRDGAWTFTISGTTTRQPFPGLSDTELTRHKGQLLYPNLMLSLSADHVTAFILWPQGPAATTVVCDFLFHPDEIAKPDFDPSDAVDFWDMVNRQDWRACTLVQRGMTSRRFEHGFYAPMEDWSKDIRRYIDESLQ